MLTDDVLLMIGSFLSAHEDRVIPAICKSFRSVEKRLAEQRRRKKDMRIEVYGMTEHALNYFLIRLGEYLCIKPWPWGGIYTDVNLRYTILGRNFNLWL